MLEEHHIWPRCLGGGDEEENTVLLTPREHLLAHRLLIEITQGADRAKMSYAYAMMACCNPNQARRVSTQKVLEGRSLVSAYCRGRNHPAYGSRMPKKQRAAISGRMKGAGNPMYGKVPWNKGKRASSCEALRRSGESYRRTVQANPSILAGRAHCPEAKAKIGAAHRGKPKSAAHRRKISASLSGRGPSREAIEKSAASRRGVAHEKVLCPWCGREGGRPAMLRWHFENCKEKK